MQLKNDCLERQNNTVVLQLLELEKPFFIRWILINFQWKVKIIEREYVCVLFLCLKLNKNGVADAF